MTSWLRPSKRSARVTLPLVASNSYRFSTFSQGSARRWRLNSSRRRVTSFSLRRTSLRAASHSACETMVGCATASVLLAMMILLGRVWRGKLGVLHAQFLDCDCRESAGGGDAAGNQHCSRYTQWKHTNLLTFNNSPL